MKKFQVKQKDGDVWYPSLVDADSFYLTDGVTDTAVFETKAEENYKADTVAIFTHIWSVAEVEKGYNAQ